MADPQALMECVLCRSAFTEDEIGRFEYFFESGVCYSCYRKMYRQPASVSCFGKKFSATAIECKRICPDRKVCPLFQSKEIKAMREEALTEAQRKGALALLRQKEEEPRNRNHPFMRGAIIYEAFELCRKGCDKGQLQRFIQKNQADLSRILRIFRREEIYGKQWDWKETEGRYSIRFPRRSER